MTGAVHQLRAAGIKATGSSVRAQYRDVSSRIVEAAQERGSDAIFLESERHRRLGRLFSPNVRVRTVRLTSLPIVTAPSPLEVPGVAGPTLDDVARLQFERQMMAPLP